MAFVEILLKLMTLPKYKAYQEKIRNRQLERAQKIIDGNIKKRKGKNQNDPARFVKETKTTADGEIAEKSVYELDQNRIDEESKYDGFYAVITNLEDNVEEILSTIRSMQLTLLSSNSGYIPSYKRTNLTDELHKIFGFHTDYEFIKNQL